MSNSRAYFEGGQGKRFHHVFWLWINAIARNHSFLQFKQLYKDLGHSDSIWVYKAFRELKLLSLEMELVSQEEQLFGQVSYRFDEV